MAWSDGLNRPLREIQTAVLNDNEKAYDAGAEVISRNLPPGAGKSAIARATQIQFDKTDIATANNALVKQYADDYPTLNVVMGKSNYEDEEEYHLARTEAKTRASIFNPLSHYYARMHGLRRPDRLIIDEAHLLLDQLFYLGGYVIPVHKSGVPEDATSELDLIRWVYDRYKKLEKVRQQGKLTAKLVPEFEKMARLYHSLQEGTEKSLFTISKEMLPYNGRWQKCLILTPLRVPEALVRTVLDADKVFLMSGTMSKYDATSLAAGRRLVHVAHDYLSPPSSRPIYYRPLDPQHRTNPEAIAKAVAKIYRENPVPTMVHVTYDQQAIIAEFLDDYPILVNSTKNKAQVKEKFIRQGGIWLAAGCAEGIDLPYKQCQQMIVPRLLFPDRGDMFVQKRIGLEDGGFWYSLRTYQNTIQRLGRGLRAADDECISYILDPAFPSVYSAAQDQFAPINVVWSQS